MDEFTLRHLVAWIDRTLRREEHDAALAAMSRVIYDDPSISDLGWPRVAEIAGIW